MIGRLQGRLIEKHPPQVLIDIGGVGYEVAVPMSTFSELPEPGATVTLLTHHVVREDAQQLYGFASAAERSIFRSLIKISGVGPKLALAILSGMSVDEILTSIGNNDVAALVRMPGVGKKTAERVLVELRDKIPRPLVEKPGEAGRSEGGEVAGPEPGDAVRALVALGYKPHEAQRMVAKVPGAGQMATQDLIRRALQAVAR